MQLIALPFPFASLIHQNGDGQTLHGSLRQLDVFGGAAGLVGDVFGPLGGAVVLPVGRCAACCAAVLRRGLRCTGCAGGCGAVVGGCVEAAICGGRFAAVPVALAAARVVASGVFGLLRS